MNKFFNKSDNEDPCGWIGVGRFAIALALVAGGWLSCIFNQSVGLLCGMLAIGIGLYLLMG